MVCLSRLRALSRGGVAAPPLSTTVSEGPLIWEKMGWVYLVLDPLLFRREGTGLVCHFANGNTEPEGGRRSPCVGCTFPRVLSVSLQLPSLQAEPTATVPSVGPQGQSSLARSWPTWHPLGPPQSRTRFLGNSLGGGLRVTVGSRLVPPLHPSESLFTNGHNLPS